MGLKPCLLLCLPGGHWDHHNLSWSLFRRLTHSAHQNVPFSPFIFSAWEPLQLPNLVAIAPRTEVPALRCYARAGFEKESSRSAGWGKKGHSASDWQRWKKVPLWSIIGGSQRNPKDKVSNIGSNSCGFKSSWPSLWLAVCQNVWFFSSFFWLTMWQVGKLVNIHRWLFYLLCFCVSIS